MVFFLLYYSLPLTVYSENTGYPMPTTEPDAIPRLNALSQAPEHQLEQRLFDRQIEIESWFREQWRQVPLIFYGSVDLRNAGFKLAPVDTNLFPAGFNNLNPSFMPLYIHAMQVVMDKICPASKGQVLLIPENHTSNLFYFENLATLHEIFTKAGFVIRIGSLLDDLQAAKTIALPSGRSITLEPIQRVGARLTVGDFSPCLILLNNDLASGVPEILQGLEQTVFPSLQLGWQNRSKANHFVHYTRVSQQFADYLQIDPWLISPLSRDCDKVNFLTKEGETELMAEAERLLTELKAKYQQYQIPYPPFLVIKADAGTYGMAVMMIKDVSEIQHLNRKQRQSMTKTKGGHVVSKVVIQEGVYTFETWGSQHSVAEPVVYLLGHQVLGGFYRVHADKGVDENLNAPGMNFQPLAFTEACNNPCAQAATAKNRCYAYGVIARLALLAAAWELKEVTGNRSALS